MAEEAPNSSATQISEESIEKKKNKPKDTRLRQQKLSAWQPILTSSTVIPAFMAVGLLFIPIGVALVLASNSVYENVTDYTNCNSTQQTKQSCTDILVRKQGYEGCYCEINIAIKEFVKGNVYFYYGLKNFYQNHRRYVKSRNDEQLLGFLKETSDCAPYETFNSSVKYAPCGAIANSLFNDTFKLYPAGQNVRSVPWRYDKVPWPVDKRQKFKNPGQKEGHFPDVEELKLSFKGYARPPDWSRNIWELDGEDAENNGFLNSEFIVWMRTAALPNFRKLYRILDKNGTYENGLPQGNYTLKVNYRYPVSIFNGRKLFIISTTSWAGAKNHFLGIAYLIVGSLCIIMGIVFLIIHLKFGKTLTDISAIRSVPT